LVGGPGKYSLSRLLGQAVRGSRWRRRTRARKTLAAIVAAVS
jgi:hypothetical protein